MRTKRDAFQQLLLQGRMRNRLLAEVAAQRVAQQVRSMVPNYVDVDTYERDTDSVTATRIGPKVASASVRDSSLRKKRERGRSTSAPAEKL